MKVKLTRELIESSVKGCGERCLFANALGVGFGYHPSKPKVRLFIRQHDRSKTKSAYTKWIKGARIASDFDSLSDEDFWSRWGGKTIAIPACVEAAMKGILSRQ